MLSAGGNVMSQWIRLMGDREVCMCVCVGGCVGGGGSLAVHSAQFRSAQRSLLKIFHEKKAAQSLCVFNTKKTRLCLKPISIAKQEHTHTHTGTKS